jgi:integrase
MSTFKFSKATLDKLANNSGKLERHQDTIQHGLHLSVTPAGVKTFRIRIWDSNRKKRVEETIGQYPRVTISTAREIVAERLNDINRGIDTAEALRLARDELTLDEVFAIWLVDYAQENNKRWKQDEGRYQLYIKPHFGKRKISSIAGDDIIAWRSKLLKQERQRGGGTLTKGTVQRAVTVLSSIYSNSAKRTHNPCSEVTHYAPQKRGAFLKTSALDKFFRAVHDPQTPEYLRDYLLLSLYTGARQSNVLSMRWAHIDLNIKMWIIPGDEMKNEEMMIVPLTKQAVEILEQRKRRRSSVFVFPAIRKGKTGHFVEPKKGWKKLLERAGLPSDYRLHDIRRTMGSWQAITGSSTKIIGASLGHKSSQATEHYAHLTVDPVREAMQKAADEMDKQKGVVKIVKIGGGKG